MNVNVKLSLTDEERNTMYRNITGKDVKRMVSRSDVNEFVAGCVASMLVADAPSPPAANDAQHDLPPIYQPDPEDRELLAGCSASYIAGWNQVKRRSRRNAADSVS